MARQYTLKSKPVRPAGELTDKSPMPFGVHKGKLIKNVPASYLLWLWNNGVWQEAHKPIHHYIKDNIAALEMDDSDTIITHDPRKQ